ncbi:MAG: AAA family ATPase [Pseudomonadota bacterium]
MFHATRPVLAEAFRDRAQPLARLRHLADRLAAGSPEWLAVLGRRKVGKTSLLLEFERTCPDPAVRFVIIDAFQHAPISVELFRRYAARVLDAAYARDAGISFEALLVASAGQYRTAVAGSDILERVPRELRPAILDLAGLHLDQGTLSLLLDLPERLAQAEGFRVIAAWDEFQEIATWSGRSRPDVDVLALMRATWQRHERVAYVISGSAPGVLRELVHSSDSPFFQHFSILELAEMARPDAMGLLIGGGVPGPLAERAVEVFGGHPFYLQLLGDELLLGSAPLDATALKEATQNLLFSRTGRLALYFEREFHALVGKSALLAHLLEALASAGAGGARLTDLAQSIGSPSGATRGYLERLGDALTRTDSGSYRLADPVFGLWLRWRSPAGAAVPMTVLGSEGERAAATALARLGFDLVYQSRASRGAFDLLAIRGPRSLGVQVKRSPLPLVFDHETWSRMETEGAVRGWRWVIGQVGRDGATMWLDPARARKRKTVRLDTAAAIDNLLLWLG